MARSLRVPAAREPYAFILASEGAWALSSRSGPRRGSFKEPSSTRTILDPMGPGNAGGGYRSRVESMTKRSVSAAVKPGSGGKKPSRRSPAPAGMARPARHGI